MGLIVTILEGCPRESSGAGASAITGAPCAALDHDKDPGRLDFSLELGAPGRKSRHGATFAGVSLQRREARHFNIEMLQSSDWGWAQFAKEEE